MGKTWFQSRQARLIYHDFRVNTRDCRGIPTLFAPLKQTDAFLPIPVGFEGLLCLFNGVEHGT